ncbi:THAP-type domain-containing protein [Aphis craccivora]|uniref:THAP-type domain-containing protein n=1 Tax=Aphis craccivora TaxID=307492 RepID=A0A6G0YHL2_APHCR|nr:THAP-type domain-containing protein [Aphis craccivora]
MKKLKVLHPAQIFSQRVGSIMKLLATWSANSAVKQLDPSAVDTAVFCFFMYKLFDSVNGSINWKRPEKCSIGNSNNFSTQHFNNLNII